MADSTSPLTQIATAQAQKEVTVNNLVDALSLSAIFGRRAEGSALLTWAYYGGRWGGLTVLNGTLALEPSADNYIVAGRTTGGVALTTSDDEWNDTQNYMRLYKVVTGSASVTSYEDHRAGPGGVFSASVDTIGDLSDVLIGSPSPGQVLAWGDPYWVPVSLPVDVYGFYPSTPGAATVVLRVPIIRAMQFPGNFAGAYGVAVAAADATAVFDILKNGSSVGTMSFAAAATSATFTSSSGDPVAFAVGDILEITAPSPADATLADIGFGITGSRT